MSVKRFREKRIKELLHAPSNYQSYKTDQKGDIRKVAQQLERNPHHMVVVLDDNSVPVGLVAQTDVVRILGTGKGVAPTEPVSQVMNTSFAKISEEKTVDDAIALMNSLDVNKLVVVGADETFRGVIHKLDIIKEARKLL